MPQQRRLVPPVDAGRADAGFLIVAPATGDGGQKQTRPNSAKQESAETRTPGEASAKGEKIKEDLDTLMNEIDEVLEENAEEFVKNYVQRGGE